MDSYPRDERPRPPRSARRPSRRGPTGRSTP